MKQHLTVRLYEAYRHHRGIRLSAEDLQDLVGKDEALQTRIASTIAGWDVEFGGEIAAGTRTVAELRRLYDECR